MPCVSGVLSQHVAACRVETTLRGWWAPPIELVGGGSVRGVGGWVGGVVVAMVIRAFLFAPPSQQLWWRCSCVCVFVCVCVRAFVCSCAFAPLPPSLPPYIYIYIFIFIFQ